MIFYIKYTSFQYQIPQSKFGEANLILSFSSVKGGVSKSTSCCNLAYYFANKGNKILVVDFDSQGGSTHHLSSKFGKKFKASIFDVLNDGCSVDYSIHSYTKNLDLIPISFSFHTIASTDFSPKLKSVIAEVETRYDFVFFDLAPSIYPGSTIPLFFSTFVIIPVDCPGGLSLLGLEAEIKIITELREQGSKAEILGVLPGFLDRTKMAQDVVRFLEKKYSGMVFPPIRRNTLISQASSLGKTIFEYKKSSNGAKDYAVLGEAVLKKIQQKQKGKNI